METSNTIKRGTRRLTQGKMKFPQVRIDGFQNVLERRKRFQRLDNIFEPEF